MKKLRVRTVILSDVHLGARESKVREANHFLRHIRCDKLILNGDIIDGWQLRRAGQWTKSHTRFIRIVLKMMEKKDTEVVYIRGNHDDILAKFLPLNFARLSVVEDHVHVGPRGPYLVLHGDIFDSITSKFVFLAHVGDWGYNLLLQINRGYNAWRLWRGKEYWSLSKAIKARVKSAVSHISKFEDHLARLARQRGCIGVICGHIHTPADKMIGSIHYLNSGDWVETLTGIVEHRDGRFEVIDFVSFARSYPMEEDEVRKDDPASLEETLGEEEPQPGLETVSPPPGQG